MFCIFYALNFRKKLQFTSWSKLILYPDAGFLGWVGSKLVFLNKLLLTNYTLHGLVATKKTMTRWHSHGHVTYVWLPTVGFLIHFCPMHCKHLLHKDMYISVQCDQYLCFYFYCAAGRESSSSPRKAEGWVQEEKGKRSKDFQHLCGDEGSQKKPSQWDSAGWENRTKVDWSIQVSNNVKRDCRFVCALCLSLKFAPCVTKVFVTPCHLTESLTLILQTVWLLRRWRMRRSLGAALHTTAWGHSSRANCTVTGVYNYYSCCSSGFMFLFFILNL